MSTQPISPRTKDLLDYLHGYGMKTLAMILEEQAVFTEDQRSLAWCPEPPHEAVGGHDCRLGGSGGLDFNFETRRARWRRARFRFRREEMEAVNGNSKRG